MSTLDTPLVEDQTSLDTPIEDTPVVKDTSERLESFKALKSAYMDSYITGKPITQGYLEYRGVSDKDAVLHQLSAKKLDEDNRATNEVLEQIAVEDSEVFTEAVEVEVDNRKTRQIQAADPTKQFVDAVSTPETTDEDKAAVANYIKLYELLEVATKDYGIGSYTMDILANLVPFMSTGREVSTLGSLLNNEDVVRDIILNFKSLPFEEQQELFPSLSKELLEGLGPIRGKDVLTKFIDPNTEDELGDFSNWWKLLDVVDIASLGVGTVGYAARLKQSFNMPKVLNGVGNKEKAAETVAASLADEQVAKTMNLSQETAFGDAVAFDISIEDPSYTKGISTESQEAIASFFGRADRSVEDIMSGNGYMKEGILNNVERAAREKVAFDKLSEAKHEEITLVQRTENTSTFQFKAKDSDGNYFDQEFTLDLTLDDVGQWDQSQLAVGSQFINSPTVFAKGLTRLDADTAQRVDDQTSKIFKELTTLQTEAVSSLGNLLRPKNRKKLEKVEQVLRMGDEYKDPVTGARGKVFDALELRALKLDDSQIEAYYKTNRLYNNLWRLRNNNKREEMIAFKYKKVNIKGNEYSFGKPHETDGAAYSAIVQGNVRTAFNVTTGKVVNNLDKKYIEKQYADGKILVKMPEPYAAGEGLGKYTHIFVEANKIDELPAVVLNRKKGYVPKIAKDGFWFVKEMGEVAIDGKSVTKAIRTHRYFDNKADADKYRETLITDAMNKQGLTRKQAEAKYENFEDREQEIIATATGQFSHGSGGLYTAARAEDDILFGLNGDLGQRINPYEALVRNIANVSRMVPINQWRLGLEQRWINTARALTGEDITSFKKFSGTIESTRHGEFLNKMFDQIRDWQGFPSKEEQVYSAMNQRLYEWALKGEHNNTAKLVGWLRDKDPIAASRAAAFHSLLGWFNPAQLWVQAQGMSIAVSINLGKNLTKTLKDTTALTILGQGDEISAARIGLAAKAAGVTPDELMEVHRLWKKTGLEDSVLQTADHAAAIRGHGIAMDAISKAADKGLFFYRGGELLNRRMAFTTALDELKSGGLKGFEGFTKASNVTDEALKAVLDRTHNLMLNLSKANRAQWQKGLASVPTQFFQVSAKALETVWGFNDNLTAAERARVLAGQVALYGAAGIPLAGLGVNYALEVLGVTQDEIDNNPLLVKIFNDGFWGFTTLGIFGVDAEVAKRGSLIRGVTDFVDNWMFSESTVGVKLMGAFGATQSRFWDSFTEHMRPLTMSAYPTDIIDIAKLPTMPFLDTISTWRNGEKAVFMEAIDMILDKHGDPTVQRDFGVREAIMTAIGFQLSDETQSYTLSERERNLMDANKRIADSIVGVMNEVVMREATNTLTEDYKKQVEQFYATIYGTLTLDRESDVRRAVQSRLMKEDKQSRAIRKYIEKVVGNTTDSLLLIRDGMLGTPVQTVNKPEEE